MLARLRYLLLVACCTQLSAEGLGQLVGYVVKGGPSIGTQRWDDFEQDPLVGFHAVGQVESISEASPRTVYAALGFHRRGSAIRTGRRTYVDRTTGEEVRIANRTIPFRFDNVALTLGAKQIWPAGEGRQVFFSVGVRGERTVAVNLGGDVNNQNYGFGLAYPVEEFVTRWLYGVDFGGGFDFELAAALDGVVELRVSPDMSRQYFQPPLGNVVDPVTGNNVALRERSIRNLSLELSVGLRFLRYGA